MSKSQLAIRIGLGAYVLLAVVWSLGNFFVWTMGPCPAFAGHDSCDWSVFNEFWLFPVSQTTFVIVGVILFKAANRLK